MGNPASSLSNLVSWLRVLPALGIEAATGILPATTTCPVCRGASLSVFDDRVVGGQWGHCGQCGFAGDLIELVSRAWGLDIPCALVKLSDLDLLSEPLPQDRIEGYLRDHIRARQRFNEFWRQAQIRPVRQTPPGLCQLLRHFGLFEQANDSSWLERGGRFVGTADYHQAQELFAPSAYAQQPRVNHNGKTSVRRGAGPGRYRLFKGGNWAEVLVMPFFDLPGRICGLLLAGRDIDSEAGDIVYKPANFQSSATPFREGGLAMWDAMSQAPHHYFRDTLFVIADPLVALQLHGRSFRDSFAPLPIVASYFDARVKTNAAMAHVPNRKLVLWGKNPYILKQAKAADALVSCYPISDKEIQRNLRHHEPVHWLQLILKDAKHWAIALREQLRNCDPATAEALLRQMDFAPDELRKFIAYCDETLRGRLEQCSPLRIASRKVMVAGKAVVETDSGWLVERTGERICHAPVRIEEVVRTDDGETYYRGTVKMTEEPSNFTIPAVDADRRGLLPCLREVLLGRGEGLLQYQPHWAKHSVYIATELGQPRIRTGIDRIGWHETERRFVFPRFNITANGEIRDDLRPLIAGDHVPAMHLEDPRLDLLHEDLAILSADRPEVPLFWAVVAGIVHNLLAPAMHSPACGILLDGPGAEITGAAAAMALGCIEVDLRRRDRHETILQRINRACGRHDWPAVLSLPESRALQVTSQWVESRGARNAILSLNPYATLSLATNPGFHLIRSTEPAAPLGPLGRVATKVIPVYVQDLCVRNLWFDLTARIRVLDLLYDMARWLGRRGGDPAAVKKAESVLFANGQSPHIPFLRLVYRLYANGRLPVARADFDQARRTKAAIVYQPSTAETPDSVWIPMRSLNRLVGSLGAPALDTARISKSLDGQPGFLGVAEYLGEAGWVFEDAWWTGRYHKHCGQGGETLAACEVQEATTPG